MDGQDKSFVGHGRRRPNIFRPRVFYTMGLSLPRKILRHRCIDFAILFPGKYKVSNIGRVSRYLTGAWSRVHGSCGSPARYNVSPSRNVVTDVLSPILHPRSDSTFPTLNVVVRDVYPQPPYPLGRVVLSRNPVGNNNFTTGWTGTNPVVTIQRRGR